MHNNPVGWHAVVQRRFLGPHGPKVKGPLVLWVLIYAKLADQWTDSHCATGFWEPELDPTINRNMDSRPMVGTTYLERPAPAVYLDSRPTEGKVIGPLALWVLNYAKLADQRTDSHRPTGFWEPELDPTIIRNLDSRPMVGQLTWSVQLRWFTLTVDLQRGRLGANKESGSRRM